MSFECKYYNNGKCELLEKSCIPGQKGCILTKAKVFFIGEKEKNDEKKDLFSPYE